MTKPRLSIPTRIFLGFAVLLVLWAVLSGLSLVQHGRTARTLRLLHEGYLPLALTLGEAKASQAVFTTLLDRVVSSERGSPDRSWLVAARRVRPATLRRALHGVDRAQRLAAARGDRETIAHLRRGLAAVDHLFAQNELEFDAVFEALARDDVPGAEAHLASARLRELAIQRHFRDGWREVQERVATISAEASAQERDAYTSIAVMTVLGLLLGVAVTVWARRVLRPLPLLHERVQAVARGEFSRALTPKRDDELGRLTHEFERMVSALAARDANLREAAEAQRRLQRIQEQIVEGLRAAVVVVGGDDGIRMMNGAAERVLGLSPADVGRTPAEVGLAARLPPVAEMLATVRATGGPEARSAVPLRTEPERVVDLRATAFGAQDEAKAGAVLLVADDVTDEVATKARLLQHERLAAIGRMASHVTHEVRNPLSSIALNVEMLGDELADDDGEARALLRSIQREVDRLTGVTEEYLRLARVPAPRLESMDIADLIGPIADFVRREMTAASVELAVTVERGLPPVLIDEGQMRQALLNLLRNAREAMPDGGRVELSASRDDGDVAIRVRDHGSGLPDEVRAKIFDLFFTTKSRGTGLGLPLTQQIVLAHGGRIECDGADGEGATFTIHLPAAANAEARSEA